MPPFCYGTARFDQQVHKNEIPFHNTNKMYCKMFHAGYNTVYGIMSNVIYK